MADPQAIDNPFETAAPAQNPNSGAAPNTTAAPAPHPDAIDNPFDTPPATPQAPAVQGDNRSWTDKAKEFVNNIMSGAAAGATQHIGNAEATIAQGIHDSGAMGQKLGILSADNASKTADLVPQVGIDALKAKAAQEGQTQNPTQAVGKGIESAGEFMLPGVGEEAAIGKGAGLAAKAAYGAATGAAVNKAQGGTATGGAAMGVAGAGLEAAAQKIAPKLMESALGVTPKMRGNGRTIGDAMLEHTVGVNPGEISGQARQAIGVLQHNLETAAAASKTPASTAPALQVIDDAITDATKQNSAAKVEQLKQLRSQLTTEFGTGNLIPQSVPPSRILDLKRGVGDLVSRWGPEERKAVDVVKTNVYRALDSELDRTVPGAQKLNQTMSSLIPGKQAAAKTANKAGIIQTVLSKGQAATGALVGAGYGGHEGYKEGGIPGAVAGGLAGAALPVIATSPQATLLAARAASKVGPVASRAPGALIEGLTSK
jgi:hypothetical protein